MTLTPHVALLNCTNQCEIVQSDKGDAIAPAALLPLQKLLQAEFIPELLKQWAAPVAPIPVLSAEEKQAQVRQ